MSGLNWFSKLDFVTKKIFALALGTAVVGTENFGSEGLLSSLGVPDGSSILGFVNTLRRWQHLSPALRDRRNIKENQSKVKVFLLCEKDEKLRQPCCRSFLSNLPHW